MGCRCKRDFLLFLAGISLLGAGCASSEKETSEGDSRHTTLQNMQRLLTEVETHLQTLEIRIATLNDKLDANRQKLENSPTPTATPTEVIQHPSENAGGSTQSAVAPHDPEAGFLNDEAVQTFRKSMFIFMSQKYSESVLAFSGFLEKFPDHVLAGSAQYYIGQAYMKQKEYRLAIQEFQRVLTSYDRSSHVSDTLNELATAEEIIKNTQDAAQHRQLLTSLFPQSPAAWVPKKTPENFNTPLDAPPTIPPLTAPLEDHGKAGILSSDSPAPVAP